MSMLRFALCIAFLAVFFAALQCTANSADGSGTAVKALHSTRAKPSSLSAHSPANNIFLLFLYGDPLPPKKSSANGLGVSSSSSGTPGGISTNTETTEGKLQQPAVKAPQQTLTTDNGVIKNEVTGTKPQITGNTVDGSTTSEETAPAAAEKDKPSLNLPPVITSANIHIKSGHNPTSSHSGENGKETQQTEISTAKTVVPPETTETSEHFTSAPETAKSTEAKNYLSKLSKAAQHVNQKDNCIDTFSLFSLATFATMVVVAVF